MAKLNNMEREEFICQAYLNRTHTTTQLQKEFKIYPTEIYKVLKKNNIELRGSNLPKEKALKICEEYKSGKSLKKVCEELSVAESTVLKIIKKYICAISSYLRGGILSNLAGFARDLHGNLRS